MVVLPFAIINNSNRYIKTTTKIMPNIEDINSIILIYHKIQDDELFDNYRTMQLIKQILSG